MTVKSMLADSRSIRALEGRYTQKMMFTLRSSGLYAPATEKIRSVKDHDQSIQSGAYNSRDIHNMWRTGEYAFYPKGFEKKNLPLGDKLVYVEVTLGNALTGIKHILNIPDVPVSTVRPDGKSETVGLRQAIGMGVIKLEKLKLDQIDAARDAVSVTTDFDPATDVKVVDIMRPDAWALVDADGYPLKSKLSTRGVSEARYSRVRNENRFEKGSTGYHGSVVRCAAADFSYYNGRDVFAEIEWEQDSRVTVEAKEPAKSG